MNPVLCVRKHCGMTQSAMAGWLGVSQGNVSFYERGQTVPPAVAAKLIDMAAQHGLSITFDHVYGAAPMPTPEPDEHNSSAAR